MMCQGCQKALATVHMVDIQGGKKKEVHLCEACAQSKGIPPQTLPMAALSGAEPLLVFQKEPHVKKSRESACRGCGMTFKQFRAKGRFGCHECYDMFQSHIVQLLDKIQGSTHYSGKIPESVGPGPTSEVLLVGLRKRLTRVVQEEQYEEAARLRDQIQQLEDEHDQEPFRE